MRTLFGVLLVALAVSASISSPKPFNGKKSYTYRFDTQVSSSLIGASPADVQQAATTRLRADAQLVFNNDRHATLFLNHVKIGELNSDMPKSSQKVQPLEHFEKKDLSAELKNTLEQPLSFTMTDGVIERINFSEDDSTWSKNLKRAVLNLLQLNLKRNDVQGLKMQSSMPEQNSDVQSPMFSVPEITLEGECEVVYTIQRNQRFGSDEDEKTPFNVTKTINFNKCQKTADLSFGYQPNPAQQLRCLKCLNQQKHQQQNAEEREQARFGHCQQECQANKPNENKDVEKSTFARFELIGKESKYAIKRSSMVSQYVVKAQNPQSQNTLIQVVAISELNFREETDASQQKVQSFKQSSADETLLYSNEFDVKEKRFYAYGDEEFQKQSPFHKMQKKDQKVAHIMNRILRQWADKQQGYELDAALHFGRLVELVRRSSVQEIRTIEQTLLSVAQQHEGQPTEHSKELAMTIYQDSLASAATRNSLFVLSEKIMKGEIKPTKAVMLLKSYTTSQIAPSESQANILQKIASSEVAHRSPALKQTAWLSFGQTVGAICQDKPAEGQKQQFNVEQMCSRGKKDQYKKTLMSLWQKSESAYEKILALKAIGNAALDNSINDLKQIVKDKQQSTLVRIEAIDAMRRLRTSLPEKIQQVLLPIFQNQREQPEIRMAAFSMVLYTQPEKSILDQLIFTCVNDRSQNVKSFVLTALESLASSPASSEQEIANHMKAALKMIRLEPQQLRASRKYRVPIYVSEQENTEEQNIFVALTSIVSPANMIPIHLSSSIRTALNGEATEENFQLSFTQKNLQQWYERVYKYAQENYGENEEQDQQNERKYAKDLTSIYSSLKTKNRRSGSYFLSSEESSEQEQGRGSTKSGESEPFGMIVLRTNDVDYTIVPISEQTLPQIVRKLMNGEKPSMLSQLEQLSQSINDARFRQHIGMSVEKKTKIPTTSGLPLSLTTQMSGVASVEGQLKVRFESDNLDSSRGLTAELKLRTSGIATHLCRSSVWSPVVISGVETQRTVELNGPIDLRLRADKTKGVELKVKLPQDQRVRFAAVHTLPVTFTRQFDVQTMALGEARVKTINNWSLEHTLREHPQNNEHVLQIEGHYHHVTSFKQFLQAMYTTENAVHVFYNPTERSPKELTLRISGSAFQKHSEHSRPELDSFYSKNRGFQSIYEDDEDNNMSQERHEQRRQSLATYSEKYSSPNSYKHQMNVEVEAHCGQKVHKASAEIKGACDQSLKHCKVFINAQRTPMHNENGQWTLKTKIQTVAPEMVGQQEDDEQMSKKQSRMLVQIDNEWGTEQKSHMNIRLQAEPTRKQRQNSRFLNKIDVVAEYQMHSQVKQIIDRAYQLLKAKLFWTMSSSLESKNSNDQGIVRATIVVDPITRRHANLTIQTPTELLRAQALEMPIRVPQYTLQRRSSPIRSFGGLIQSVANYGGAECKINNRRIKTFDGVSYKAPSSECWSVLAKDCSRDEPRFVVMQKKVDEETKLKIVTPRKTIELIGKESKIVVKVNGQVEKDQQELSEQGIEQSYDGVYISISGVKVQFDGEEAKVSISGMYKNLQCGLCGHNNDEQDDDFYMPNGKRSGSLKQFHQSYTLKNEECDEKKLNKFYEQDSNEFSIQPRQQSRRQQQSGRWFDDESNESTSDEYTDKSEQQDQQQKGGRRSPVSRTKVIEYSHRMCFSVKPIKQCPKNTFVDDEAETQQVKAEFFCLDRSSSEARRLQRQVREGRVVETTHAPSFVEEVEQPTRCRAVSVY